MKNIKLCVMILAGMLATSVNVANAAIVGGGITTKTGTWQFLSNPSASLPKGVGKDTIQKHIMMGFNEDKDIIWTPALQKNTTLFKSWDWQNSKVLTPTTIAAGTHVDSHYVFYDPKSNQIGGYVDFSTRVLGIIVGKSSLLNTDFMGLNSIKYLNPEERGFEITNNDWARIDPNNSKRIQVHFEASSPGDYIRVLTQTPPAPVPVPAPLLLLGSGLLGLAGARTRKEENA